VEIKKAKKHIDVTPNYIATAYNKTVIVFDVSKDAVVTIPLKGH